MPQHSHNRTRLRFEDLEGRALPDVKGLGELATLLTDAPEVRRAVGGGGSAGDSTGGTGGETTVAGLRYSAVTIKNATAGRITYKIHWGGAPVNITLLPGQSRVHWTRPGGVTAIIEYDWNFRAGFQSQKYALDSKVFVGSSTTFPRIADGMPYTFYPAGNVGVQLYGSG